MSFNEEEFDVKQAKQPMVEVKIEKGRSFSFAIYNIISYSMFMIGNLF